MSKIIEEVMRGNLVREIIKGSSDFPALVEGTILSKGKLMKALADKGHKPDSVDYETFGKVTYAYLYYKNMKARRAAEDFIGDELKYTSEVDTKGNYPQLQRKYQPSAPVASAQVSYFKAKGWDEQTLREAEDTLEDLSKKTEKIRKEFKQDFTAFVTVLEDYEEMYLDKKIDINEIPSATSDLKEKYDTLLDRGEQIYVSVVKENNLRRKLKMRKNKEKG